MEFEGRWRRKPPELMQTPEAARSRMNLARQRQSVRPIAKEVRSNPGLFSFCAREAMGKGENDKTKMNAGKKMAPKISL